MSSLTLEQELHCQKVLDEQGYLVIEYWAEPLEVGDVIDDIVIAWGPPAMMPKLVVVGEATREEMRAQGRRYFRSPGVQREGSRFYRVVVE